MPYITESEKLIRVSDKSYPYTLSNIRGLYPLVSLPENITEEKINQLGFAKVYPTKKPEGELVVELPPLLVGALYRQQWLSRDYTASELKIVLPKTKVKLANKIKNEITVERLNQGIPFDFGEPYGIQHIQVRDGDRANLVGLRVQAIYAQKNNIPIHLDFRTFENINIPLDVDKIIEITNAAILGYYNLLNGIWTKLDITSKATTLKELPTV